MYEIYFLSLFCIYTSQINSNVSLILNCYCHAAILNYMFVNIRLTMFVYLFDGV